MNVAIRYYSKTGNTKKLADSIGQAVGAQVETVETPLSEKADVLFLGSSVYAAGVDESVKEFIRNNKEKIGTIVGFSTAALIPSTYKQIKKIAAENGVEVSNEEFHCRGSFGLMHKGRPNAKDLKDVAEFAKKICN
ncbi:MAG: flavodoxin [Lachnospiraceae bacterium]|nr:flavodoxin [Lachnospiraceae bacterium]